MTALETPTQAAIVAALRTIGCFVGVNTTGHRGKGRVRAALGKGATDLIVVDCGLVTFAEIKRSEHEVLSDDQRKRHAELRRAGGFVVVWWSVQMAVDDVMERRRTRR